MFPSLGRWLRIACFMVTVATADLPLLADTIHVAPAPLGDDAADGAAGRVASRAGSGPVATLGRAREILRERRQAGRLRGAAEILLLEGRHEVAGPVEFGSADSGADGAELILRGQPGKRVVLSGGRIPSGWRRVSGDEGAGRVGETVRSNLWVSDLRARGVVDLGTAADAGNRLEFFHRGRPMQLARWPNEGFVRVGNLSGGQPIVSHGLKGDAVGRFRLEGDRMKGWTGEPEIFLHGYWFWDWSDSHQKVGKLEPASGVLELTPPHHGYGYREGQRFYAVNLLSELDRPGEWYADRSTGLLYFWPEDGREPTDSVVSVASGLLRFSGVSWFRVEGLILEAARGDGIRIERGSDGVVGGCRIRTMGAWGVRVEGGVRHRVEGNDLEELGEGGIYVNGGDRLTLTPASHRVANNHIRRFGRVVRTYRPAVQVDGVGQAVVRNWIHDGPHNAIQLMGNDHLIEGNEIHDVCYETGDVGAFYTGRDWTARGTVIRGNYFHDIRGPGLHGAMGVYLDDSASGFKIVQNLFVRAGRAAFIGGGRDNLVEDNIFIACEPAVHVDARGLGWMKDHVEPGGTLPVRLAAMPYRNPPWSARYPELLALLADEPGAPKGNVIRRNLRVGGQWSSIEKIAVPMVTMESNLIDVPAAVFDPENRRLRLSVDPRIREIGFNPLRLDRVGVLDSDGFRRRLPPSGP